MSRPEAFIPDPALEGERLMVVEHALGEGGLIDRHLKWVPTEESPTAEFSDGQYGYLPDGHLEEPKKGLRPKQEPVDFRLIASEVLGVDYDTDFVELATQINEVDSGWFRYVVSVGLLDVKQADAMQAIADKTYRVNTLTEDNIPAYMLQTLGMARIVSVPGGLHIPATEEWYRGLWQGEEEAHKMSMNKYGDIRGITASRSHSLGRTSQIRAGMEQQNTYLTKGVVYTSGQEFSTHLAHRRVADLYGPVGNALLMNIASDESLHHMIYTDLGTALRADERFANDVVRTVREVMTPLSGMPGEKGIPYFNDLAKRIHLAAIYGLEQAYEAGRKVTQRYGLLDESKPIIGLDAAGEEDLLAIREYYAEPTISAPHAGRFILGQTVDSGDLRRVRKQYMAELGLSVAD